MSCAVCGSLCVHDKKYDMDVFVCIQCGMEYLKDGSYLKLPWLKEPLKSEQIKCTGKELFDVVYACWKDNMVFYYDYEYIVSTLFDIMTYKMQEFDTTPYIGIMASGNEKGKSRGARLHAELSYRGTPVSRPSDAFVKKVLTDGGTLIIDQAEDAFYDAKNNKTVLYNMFTSGYQRGIPTGQLAPDKMGYDQREIFGAKVFTMQDDGKTDNALESRSLMFYMQQGVPINKQLDTTYRLNKGKPVMHNPVKIRAMMHYYRDQKLTFDEETELTGRLAEIVDPLIYTVRMLALPEYYEEVLYKYAFRLRYEKADVSRDTFPYRVLAAISHAMRSGTSKIVMPKDVATSMTLMCPDMRVKSVSGLTKKIGIIMRKAGLKKKEVSGGNEYDFNLQDNLEILDRMYKQYYIDDIDTKIEDERISIEKETGGKISNWIVSVDKYDTLVKLLKYRKMWKRLKEVDIAYSNIVEPADIPEEHIEQPEADIPEDEDEGMVNPDEEIARKIAEDMDNEEF